MRYKNGTEFLNKLYRDMYLSDVVMHTAKKGDTPTERIDKYLNRLEEVHNIAKTSSHKMDLLKKLYYDKYVIKELPDNYVNLQRKIARERGYGDIDVTKDLRREMLKQIQVEQEKSLDNWIDYLCSDDALYPMWFKSYAFQGMIKLGKYDKENKSFKRRTSTTVEPYLDLNREILAQIYDTLSKEIGENEPTEEQAKALENGESFQKIYAYYLTKQDFKIHDEETEGIWIKYDQGSDSKKLCDSLQGKNTGWCTAGYKTAESQLSSGDFYVYYTKDENNEYTNPRIAIRMNGNSEIAEVRGVGKEQNLEGSMNDIADKKLEEFPDKDKYKKKVNDMKRLTEIDQKAKKGEKLTKEELIFLYEINGKIKGFGYTEDPRIKEIIEKRNIKSDLSFVYSIGENNIATSLLDFNKDTVVYYGDFDSLEVSDENFKNLKVILGDTDFRKLESAEGLNNLLIISGYACFNNLKSAEGLNSLQRIGGVAQFESLESAKGLNSLQKIGGYAQFESLESAKGLGNLQIIDGDAHFSKLESAEGLGSLQEIGGIAFFESLESAKGLNNLQRIGDNAHFESLKSAGGLNNLQRIGGVTHFESLESAGGLNNLLIISGDACFSNLKSAEGLNNLQRIGGGAHFESLESAEGLNKLQIIGWTAHFELLESAKGLNNLQRIGDNAHFESLKSAKGLNNLQKINGYADFSSLKTAEGLDSLQEIRGVADFQSLKSAIGLGSLQKIHGDANFQSLKTAEGLDSLQRINSDANFQSLKTAVGLGSLQEIRYKANFPSLKTAVGLGSLQMIINDANFQSLKTAEGLDSLQEIRGVANFQSLKSSIGLGSLQKIHGDANFQSLKNAKGLNNLERIGMHAYFDRLESTEGLDNLQSIDGDSYFQSLKTTDKDTIGRKR